MSEFIPLSVPSIRGNEWKYIKECLDTEWVSSVGKYVNKFEENVCSLCGSKYAIACVNGTAALEIALKLAGVTENDEVIVPTLTFIASINVVRYCRAEPIFMDCDDYYCMDVEKTIEFIKSQTKFKNGYTYNSITGKRIAALVPVHVFGNAVNRRILELCHQRNIIVIEDGGIYRNLLYRYKSQGCFTGTVGTIGCFHLTAIK